MLLVVRMVENLLLQETLLGRIAATEVAPLIEKVVAKKVPNITPTVTITGSTQPDGERVGVTAYWQVNEGGHPVRQGLSCDLINGKHNVIQVRGNGLSQECHEANLDIKPQDSGCSITTKTTKNLLSLFKDPALYLEEEND